MSATTSILWTNIRKPTSQLIYSTHTKRNNMQQRQAAELKSNRFPRQYKKISKKKLKTTTKHCYGNINHQIKQHNKQRTHRQVLFSFPTRSVVDWFVQRLDFHTSPLICKNTYHHEHLCVEWNTKWWMKYMRVKRNSGPKAQHDQPKKRGKTRKAMPKQWLWTAENNKIQQQRQKEQSEIKKQGTSMRRFDHFLFDVSFDHIHQTPTRACTQLTHTIDLRCISCCLTRFLAHAVCMLREEHTRLTMQWQAKDIAKYNRKKRKQW